MIQKFFQLKPVKESRQDSPLKECGRISKRQALARHSELYARNHLKNLGWSIKDHNWRPGRSCEIDIIAVDPGGILVFVEVKARRLRSSQPGFAHLGFESINERKRKSIMAGAGLYLAKHDNNQAGCRFDAIVLYYQDERDSLPASTSEKPEIHHVVGIF